MKLDLDPIWIVVLLWIIVFTWLIESYTVTGMDLSFTCSVTSHWLLKAFTEPAKLLESNVRNRRLQNTAYRFLEPGVCVQRSRLSLLTVLCQ